MIHDMDEDELLVAIDAAPDDRDEDELRAVLVTEARQIPSVLESLRQHFDHSRKNASVMSVELFSGILCEDAGVAPSHIGPISKRKRDEH